MNTRKLLTAEDLWHMPDDGLKHELDEGELITMSPAGLLQGIIAGRISRLIGNYVEEHNLGVVLVSEAGFKLQSNPDKVRAPDVAFIALEKLPEDLEGYGEMAPDLAVEVISPNEYAVDVQAKLNQYLQAGARQVWLVYPRTKSIVVYSSLTDVTILTLDDELTGGDIVPGFTCKVADIFKKIGDN